MQKQSAGILLYRKKGDELQVFLVHPGGPFWKNKDAGAWSIPKGEFAEDEDALKAAIREFEEETTIKLSGNFIQLSAIKQKGGKLVYAWALQKDIDASVVKSNTFRLEWPPKSGRWQNVPEIDKGEWFDTEIAKEKINPSQVALVDELVLKVNGE